MVEFQEKDTPSTNFEDDRRKAWLLDTTPRNGKIYRNYGEECENLLIVMVLKFDYLEFMFRIC